MIITRATHSTLCVWIYFVYSMLCPIFDVWCYEIHPLNAIPGAYTLFIFWCDVLYLYPILHPPWYRFLAPVCCNHQVRRCGDWASVAHRGRRAGRGCRNTWPGARHHQGGSIPSYQCIHTSTFIPVHSYRYIHTNTFIPVHSYLHSYQYITIHIYDLGISSACVCASLRICMCALGHWYVRPFAFLCASFCVCMRVLGRLYARDYQ